MSTGCTRQVSLRLVSRGLDVGKRRDEIPENFGRHHDCVAVAAHILGDFHHHAARVALEVQKEDFPVREDFLGVQQVVVHGSF